MLSRRRLLGLGSAVPLALLVAPGCAERRAGEPGHWVNDVHAQLNRTRVRRLHRPTSTADLQALVREAAADRALCVADTQWSDMEGGGQ